MSDKDTTELKAALDRADAILTKHEQRSMSTVRIVDPVKVQLLEALRTACDVLDNVRGNINPERGYADELEAEVSQVYYTIKAATSAAQKGD